MSVSESSLVSDVVTYNAKVWLAGIAATLFVPLSLVALALDVIARRTGEPDAFARRVLEASARFEEAIDIHGDLTDVRVTQRAS
jgi:hypothetical protein